MLRTFLAAGLTALTLASPAAALTTHEVIITGNGFFPIKTYVRPGDIVHFTNEAITSVNVIAEDEDDGSVNWATGNIQPTESVFVWIIEESLLEFEMHGERWVGGNAQGEGEATETEGSENSGTGYWETFIVQGEFTFDRAQLN